VLIKLYGGDYGIYLPHSYLFLGSYGLAIGSALPDPISKVGKKANATSGGIFEKEMINASMYASQWFIIFFSYSFPFSLALQIWDVFFVEVVSCASLFHALFW